MKSPVIPAGFLQRWNGSRWRWWSLATGLLLLAATAAVGTLGALLLSQDIIAFILLLLILEILAISAVGSGLLDSATRTMNRGGLAREAADLDTRRPSAREVYSGDPEDLVRIPRSTGERTTSAGSGRTTQLTRLRDRDQENRDRRTIRAALIVLPVFVAFFVLLFQL